MCKGVKKFNAKKHKLLFLLMIINKKMDDDIL